MEILHGILGIVVLLGAACLMSNNRKKIEWRLVGAGLALALLLAFLILKLPYTSRLFQMLGSGAIALLEYSHSAAQFIVGPSLADTFAGRIGPAIIFVSGISAILYYLKVLPAIVAGCSWFLKKTMRISGAEGFSAALSFIFGQVEAQLLIKPFFAKLTGSELFTSISAGMATISASALVAYTGMGVNPTYLIAASIMSAVLAIVVSKIIAPETDFEAIQQAVRMNESEAVNFFDAATHGVQDGVMICIGVMANVLFAVAMMAALNAGLAAVLGKFGMAMELQDIFAYPYEAIAWLVGVPTSEAFHVGRLMATENLLNEFISYGELSKVIHHAPGVAYTLAPRTQLIATAALCGFANFSSIAINIAGLGRMAPERRIDVAKVAFKAFIAANIATWITACICGMVY